MGSGEWGAGSGVRGVGSGEWGAGDGAGSGVRGAGAGDGEWGAGIWGRVSFGKCESGETPLYLTIRILHFLMKHLFQSLKFIKYSLSTI
ncbi:hypothetical protein A0256_09975 [Mucilaginibacter sp. PAMC 26640]|nr:hypothetical protein A0256_09975 [Mucilaginibacter sp. PAMC 26640]